MAGGPLPAPPGPQPAPPAPPAAAPTMKAIRMHEFGGPEVLKLEDIPRPEPKEGQVLVRVHAAGVNPIDWKLRDGMMKVLPLPMTPGFDISGTVESVGAGVTKFKPGDEVFSYLPITAGGGYAQYTVAPAAVIAAKPASIDHLTAAGVPLAALTAWQALFDQAKLKEGQTVLIHGGAGGVGHFAIQFAKSVHAKVYATASDSNLRFIKSLGADEAIDYKNQKFEEIAKDVDVVLDTIGGTTQERSLGVIKKDGYLVSIVQPPSPEKLKEHGIKGSVFLVHPDAAQLAKIAALIDSAGVVPHVGEVFDLADAGKAQEKSKAGGVRGKIVLKIAGDAPATGK